ncbi:flavin-containing monooxygenase [Streptomyces turgidiscabies]|uniref:flavin-containing monooxygenase n=1 Tax=Streptomyces turgidiscabies TaxID=85558 RepID=UPI0038F7017B
MSDTTRTSPDQADDAGSAENADSALDVLVIGAGVTGVYQLYRAREAGFTVKLLEAGSGVGGVWYWNRYPEARFDSESYTYGYLFSKELWEEWEWSEKFAGQPEIERYFNHVVDRFDLRRDISFGVKVTSAVFDETSGTWTVRGSDGTEVRARFVVAATGNLSVPFIPAIPGRDDFRGAQHHTSRWPKTPVDFTGKRVAQIGTGSSGVQIISAIADDVAQLTVYQKDADWLTPLNNGPITPEEQAELKANFESIRETLNASPSGFLHQIAMRSGLDDSPEDRQAFYEERWNGPGFTKLTEHYYDMLSNETVNAEWCAFMAGKIRDIVKDPETAEKLIPKAHGYGGRRPPFGTGALNRLGVRGRHGLPLKEYWSDGPRTYLGVATAGFPNFFFPGGPHGATGNNPRYAGDQVEIVTDAIVHARDHGHDVIEVTEAAEEEWTDSVNSSTMSSFLESSYFYGGNIPGKPVKQLLNPSGRWALLELIREAVANDFPAFTFSKATTQDTEA